MSVSVCDEVTAETFAENAALVDPGDTVTFEGRVTAEPLLLRLTTVPLLGAAADKVTVQESVPAAEYDDVAHERLLRVGAAADSCNANVLFTLPAVAVSVAVWAEVTVETFAVNAAVVEPDPTVTEEGTATDPLLLVRATAKPLPVAALVNVTVQESVPAAE